MKFTKIKKNESSEPQQQSEKKEVWYVQYWGVGSDPPPPPGRSLLSLSAPLIYISIEFSEKNKSIEYDILPCENCPCWVSPTQLARTGLYLGQVQPGIGL